MYFNMQAQIPTTEPTEKLLTKDEAAEFLGLTVRTIENHMKAGLIPYYKLSRTVRFNRADVLAHLNDNCRVIRKS
jgi:excisionase family DNA binding protein